jgi:OOP family OmpA-OmpF porin
MRRFVVTMMLLASMMLPGCYMAQKSEEYYGITVEGKTVLFLLDVSGSMEGKDEGSTKDQVMQKATDMAADTVGGALGGALGNLASKHIKKEATKLGSAKRELIPTIRGLAPDVRFNVLLFGNTVTPWKPDLVEASGGNKNSVMLHLQGLSASGGTPAFVALEQAFQVAEVDTIFFLSDGLPTDNSAATILREVQTWNPDKVVTVNTIGLGDDQDQDFLCQLAQQNNGIYIRDKEEACRAEVIPPVAAAQVTEEPVEQAAVEAQTEPDAPKSDATGPIAKEYADAQGRTVYLSHGDLSFADEVISFEMGQPAATGAFADQNYALGSPNYQEESRLGATTLGCGGTLILQFTDNVLIDIDGADLHVFEVGPSVESMQVAISRDGKEWIDLGAISGGQASVDISASADPYEAYYFVRLTDLQTDCSGQWPGADVDAVAAMGTGERISLRSAVLFDFDKFDLKPEAREELERVAQKIQHYPSGRIVISGHTDNVGSTEYNQELSEKRAASVQDYFANLIGTENYRFESRGYGESSPVDTNETEEGREQNRRVEILILPVSQ